MANFIQNLYENDHFTLYLSIILVILIILFFVVLFFGKKDKKLQETQKLLKVSDGFKEEETKEKLEVTPGDSKINENDVSSNEELPTSKNSIESVVDTSEEPTSKNEKDLEKTIVLPVIEENKPMLLPKDNRPVEMIVFNPRDIKEEVKDSDATIDPSLHFDELGAALEKELTDLENIKKEFNNIELPTIEEHKEVIKPKNPQPVFSSVFAPKIDIATEEETDANFDLPTLKNDDEKEIAEVAPVEEVKEENNELPSFSFDNISGETYNLNDK